MNEPRGLGRRVEVFIGGGGRWPPAPRGNPRAPPPLLGHRQRPEEVIVHRMYMKLRGAILVALSRCAGVVALVSWRRDLHDLEIGYVGFIINGCAESVIPAFGLQEYVTESSANRYSITNT
jgi:hypothetical protein